MPRVCYIVTLFLAAFFAVARVARPGHGLRAEDVFKDLAHVFVGAVLGSACVTKSRFLWFVFVLLCVVEIIAAVAKN